ncbi:alpha/beta hydrolase [Streptomyces sp. ASQP_92]|uniref:alpha/beta fold hydrolase n=1 Tax=Streptomyces sp. ASQP_92 TaxID=2979116 RepID=UPI0021BEE5C6|nr:alpha/beta hydrolase [Streptomyces sp. ASQP_92]MCT9088706.1 alpha/beta hydrolase [Streptomyces sp. ASQP_92]
MPKFTTYDGTRLAYHLRGEGEPLLCLPGGAMRASAYLGDLGGLAAHRQLVLLDLRGTGDSEIPRDPSSYRCDRQVADVEALRAHLGLDRIDLLGHSAGGNLAMLYAAAHPERVARLALITPTPWALGMPPTPEERLAAARLRKDEPWFEEAYAAYSEVLAGRPAHAGYEALIYGRWDAAAKAHAAAGEQQYNDEAADLYGCDGAFDPVTTRAALARLDAPALVLAGEWDGGPCPDLAARTAACFADGRLQVQPLAGHFPWLDDPGAFTRTVAAFLDPDVRTVTVGGLRLAYRVWGDESAPPLVLVHGRGGDSRDWEVIAGRLAATRRVYALDLRGHGLSDWPGGYSFEAFRDDLRGFLTELGLAGADLVGHSMGGAAAALLAEDEPGLIGRLVLEETPPLFPLKPPRGPAERPTGELNFDWAVVPAIDAQLNDPDPSWRGRFAAIAAPTLVVAGGPASHVDQKKLAWMASRIPDARLVTIDAGHLVHAERPAEFLGALADFGIK